MKCIYSSEQGELAVRERYLKFLSFWPAPHRQLRVPTREGETFVVACGDEAAPPLLLFHGSAGNSAMWLPDVAAWAAHFRVYAIDMIGEAGLSAPSRPPLGSEAYALWLDDVMRELSLTRASIVGVSLGGWLALDYAARRPERVESLALMCPGGVGRQKMGILLKAVVLKMFGAWGARKLRETIFGRQRADVPPKAQKFLEFIALIHANFRPRRGKLPVFADEALRRLTMPVMAIAGGKDVFLDSAETKRRLERTVPHAEIRYLPEAGHVLAGQTQPVLDFLIARQKSCVAVSASSNSIG